MFEPLRLDTHILKSLFIADIECIVFDGWAARWRLLLHKKSLKSNISFDKKVLHNWYKWPVINEFRQKL